MKKTPGDIIILHKFTKNHDHIYFTVPEIWRVTDIIGIFYFGLFFALLKPLTAQKIKIKKKKRRKKVWRYHFTYMHQKFRSDDVWFLRYGVRRTDGKSDI